MFLSLKSPVRLTAEKAWIKLSLHFSWLHQYWKWRWYVKYWRTLHLQWAHLSEGECLTTDQCCRLSNFSSRERWGVWFGFSFSGYFWRTQQSSKCISLCINFWQELQRGQFYTFQIIVLALGMMGIFWVLFVDCSNVQKTFFSFLPVLWLMRCTVTKALLIISEWQVLGANEHCWYNKGERYLNGWMDWWIHQFFPLIHF